MNRRFLSVFGKNEFGALILSVFEKKLVFWRVKKTKNDCNFVLPLHFQQARYELIKLLNLFQPIEFSLSKFDRLDPSYQTSKARIR